MEGKSGLRISDYERLVKEAIELCSKIEISRL